MAESTNNPHEGSRDTVRARWQRRRLARAERHQRLSGFGVRHRASAGLHRHGVCDVGMFDFLYAREDAKNATNPAALMMSEQNELPPEPRLQANPKIELKDLRGRRGRDPEQLRLDRSQQGDCADTDRSGDRYRGAEGFALEAQSGGNRKRRL